ncbi:MAG: NUDIX domain-containing protein [bacterium]|nr:NUDIX domain-containing protein [bacterium]
MAHIHEKIDFTSEVFIVYKSKVLLRIHDKYHKWLSVGGHIELDEDPAEAAIREVKEEVGLNVALWNGNQRFFIDEPGVKEIIPPVFLNRHRVSDTHEHITFVYFAQSDTDQLSLSDDEISDECRWFTKEELETIELAPNIRSYASLALDTLGSNV